MSDETKKLKERIKELKAALPTPEKLRLLASWHDMNDVRNGFLGDDRVQRDLRRWAALAEKAKKDRSE